MGRRPSLARLLRELLAQLQDPRQLEKLVREQKQSPHLRQQFELQMWALYGMVQWGGEHQGHPGWIEGLLRLAKEAEQYEQSGQAYADSVLSFLRVPGRHGTTNE